MAKTILLAGKEMPAGSKFADGLVLSGRNVAVSGPEQESGEDSDISRQINAVSGVSVIEWHRTSPVSSRSLILGTETFFDKMDEAVLYFDEEWYASTEGALTMEECLRGSDELIFPYQCLTLEILSRFEKKNSTGMPGNLVFLLKESPCIADTLRSPAMRNGVSAIASPVIAAAAAAFAAFAENIAVQYGNQPFVNVLLVRGDRSTDIVASDVELAKWLGGYLQALEDNGMKASAKKSLAWLKPGTKFSSGTFFSFGKR